MLTTTPFEHDVRRAIYTTTLIRILYRIYQSHNHIAVHYTDCTDCIDTGEKWERTKKKESILSDLSFKLQTSNHWIRCANGAQKLNWKPYNMFNEFSVWASLMFTQQYICFANKIRIYGENWFSYFHECRICAPLFDDKAARWKVKWNKISLGCLLTYCCSGGGCYCRCRCRCRCRCCCCC